MKPLFTFGDLVFDVVARVEHAMDRDTDTPGDVFSGPGGSAANFAVWTARLGGACSFASRVGNDLIGRALVDDLRREGVEAHVRLDDTHPTAVLVLFAEGAQRHMMVPRGANHYFSPADLPEQVLRQAGWLHLTGYSYFWEAPRRSAEQALAMAREVGVPVSFDPSSAGFIRRQGLTVPQGVQVLIPNLDEALALTGCGSATSAARQLGEQVPLVAVKLGAQGALLCENGKLTQVEPADPGAPIIDTTGAGDAWGACFVLGLRRGLDAPAAAAEANRLGARVATSLGARPAV